MQIFKSRGHTVDHRKTGIKEEELCNIIGNYDGLVVRSATKVTETALSHSKKLKIIGRAGVGIDNINVPAATKAGIMVMNTPGGNTISTAQHTLSLLSSLARHIPAADMLTKEDKWEKKKFTGVELSGKTLAIVGCGRIGQVVAASAKNMGMNIIGYDFAMSKEALQEFGIKKAEMEDIWKQADFITFHTPLTSATKNLINDETIAKCKKGVRIINCARGGIVDEDALLRGLESGHVAGAALDVYTTEPPQSNLHALLAHPNLICTPHLGASTEEAQINVARDIAYQMCDALENKDFTGVMNVNYLALSTQKHMHPFMNLSTLLGSFLAQNKKNKITELVLKTYGGRDISIVSPSARTLLEVNALVGVTKDYYKEKTPDIISAPHIAKELGITIKSENVSPSDISESYWNLISLEAKYDDNTTSVITGSVFGSLPHIVKVNEYSNFFAFKPEGKCVLSFVNEDKKGSLSEILKVFSDIEVNIANVNLAAPILKDGKKTSICFVGLDENVSEVELNKIKQIPSLSNLSKLLL